MKNFKLILSAVFFLAAPLFAAEPSDEAQAKLDRERSEMLLAGMDCSVKKTRLFADYLSGSGGLPYKGYKFRCAAGKETINLPPWFEGAVSSMNARGVEINRQDFTQAALWREPLLALVELAELVRKTEPASPGGAVLAPRYLAPSALAILVRYDKALANLRKARLAGSLEGRGDLAFSALVRGLSDLDDLERGFGQGSMVSFYEKAASVLKAGEDAFAAVFSETPGRQGDNVPFSADYRMRPRLLEGQRAAAVAAPWWQLEALRPGDLVDLLVTYDNPVTAAGKQTGTDTITATVLQGVKVLSVSKPAEAGAKGTLRLLVTPLEAQYAALAQVQARELSVTLRAEGDSAAKPMEVANFRKIIK